MYTSLYYGRLTLYADTTSLYYVCFSLYYVLYNNSLCGVNVILLLAKSFTSYNVMSHHIMKFAHIMKLSKPYNQLDAAYKETLKHTIISHNIMK